jgi:8-oxo-dGTP diphosphatase
MATFNYEYARPAFSVDIVVFAGPPDARKLLLVRRGGEPFIGWWALPGGFVDEGERPEDTARRELAEETGVAWEGDLVQVGTWGDPGRDPRGWTVSVAYLADAGLAQLPIEAGDDAAEAAWHSLSDLPTLAFDHSEIVEAALARLGGA